MTLEPRTVSTGTWWNWYRQAAALAARDPILLTGLSVVVSAVLYVSMQRWSLLLAGYAVAFPVVVTSVARIAGIMDRSESIFAVWPLIPSGQWWRWWFSGVAIVVPCFGVLFLVAWFFFSDAPSSGPVSMMDQLSVATFFLQIWLLFSLFTGLLFLFLLYHDDAPVFVAIQLTRLGTSRNCKPLFLSFLPFVVVGELSVHVILWWGDGLAELLEYGLLCVIFIGQPFVLYVAYRDIFWHQGENNPVEHITAVVA